MIMCYVVMPSGFFNVIFINCTCLFMFVIDNEGCSKIWAAQYLKIGVTMQRQVLNLGDIVLTRGSRLWTYD